MGKDVRDALLRIVNSGKVVASKISRQSISEITMQYNGHTLHVSWYPPFGFWGRGRLRSLSFDGLDAPLEGGFATDVLRAMQRHAECEFERRAKHIISVSPAKNSVKQ